MDRRRASSATRTPTPGRSRRGSSTVDDSGDAPLVVLDRTVFYPGGGGQPSDRGLAPAGGRRPALDGPAARKAGGDIVHELEPGGRRAARRVGDVADGRLDWARRYALMRTHTALHALCGVVWRDYGALVTGGNMEPGGGRMDFEFERMTGDLVDEIEAKVNAELARRARRPGQRPAARRGVRDPRPDPDEDQPPAGGDRGDPDDRDRRARPPGRRRDPRREHPRGRRDPGHRLRVEGPDQQADPARAGRSRRDRTTAAPSTPALDALAAAGVPHRVVRTERAHSAEESAAAPGDRAAPAPPDDRRPPRRGRLPLRARPGRPPVRLAEAPGAPRRQAGCRCPTPTRPTPVTGYERDTITPFGSARAVAGRSPTPRSSTSRSSSIGGGAHGVNVHLAPADLVAATAGAGRRRQPIPDETAPTGSRATS